MRLTLDLLKLVFVTFNNQGNFKNFAIELLSKQKGLPRSCNFNFALIHYHQEISRIGLIPNEFFRGYF